MNAAADPLLGLRDIHLPPAVGLWPPAPGWYLGAALLVVGAAATLWYRRRSGARQRRAALRALAAALAQHQANGDPRALALSVSTLLRRYALYRFAPSEVAGLTGVAWLTFLDRHGGAGAFAAGPGRVLTGVPYGANEPVDTPALIRLARHWIRANSGLYGGSWPGRGGRQRRRTAHV